MALIMPKLLNVCPRGAWLSEDHAVQYLNLSSKSALKDAFREGSLPHVLVEHGKRFSKAPVPFNKHRFFYVQKEGKSVSRPEIDFLTWVAICKSVESGDVESLSKAEQNRLKDYTGYTDAEDAYPDLKSVNAIISSSQLSGEDGDDGYRYGYNGSRQRSSSKGPAEGDIYTRADGKKVRRVRRTTSGKGEELAGNDNSGRRLVRSNSGQGGSSGNLASEDGKRVVRRVVRRSNSLHAGSTHRRSLISKDENGEPVRRIKRSNSSHGARTANGSLSGFLGNDEKSGGKKLSGSRSLAEGEIYTRADGKKGELKLWSSSREMLRTQFSRFLIQIYCNGGLRLKFISNKTIVRRVKRTSTSSVSGAEKSSLSGFLNDGSSKPKKGGSASVAGDQAKRPSLTGFLKDTQSKKKSGSSSVSGDKKSSLSGFLNDGSGKKKKKSGSASVAGDKKTSLAGFLNDGSAKPKNRGSSSVAGDQIAVSKESSLTGEVYVRADGKKVRRVKKPSSNDNVEIITRPDGTKVRRIRKTKPKSSQSLGSPTSATTTATSSTDTTASSSDTPKRSVTRSLSGFFKDKGSGTPKKSGSNSIAGDQYAENEIHVRSDGKKVRRVRKTKSGEDSKSLAGFLDSDATSKPKLNGAATVVGDTRATTEASEKPEEEIYVRPDGKVRSSNFCVGIHECVCIFSPFSLQMNLYLTSRR